MMTWGLKLFGFLTKIATTLHWMIISYHKYKYNGMEFIVKVCSIYLNWFSRYFIFPGHPDWHHLWFSSIAASRYRDSTLQYVMSSLFFLLHMSPFFILLQFVILCNIICAGDITLLNKQRNLVTEVYWDLFCVVAYVPFCHKFSFCLKVS